MKQCLTLMLLLAIPTLLFAAADPHATAPAAHGAPEPHAAVQDDWPHPTPPSHADWAGRLVIGVLIMFAAAAVVGQIYRPPVPEPLPPANDAHAAHGHGQGHH